MSYADEIQKLIDAGVLKVDKDKDKDKDLQATFEEWKKLAERAEASDKTNNESLAKALEEAKRNPRPLILDELKSSPESFRDALKVIADSFTKH